MKKPVLNLVSDMISSHTNIEMKTLKSREQSSDLSRVTVWGDRGGIVPYHYFRILEIIFTGLWIIQIIEY